MKLIFDNCRVPDENILGNVGDGFIQSMKVLDGGRISIAALSLGIAKGAYQVALQYSKEREAFGQPIGGFQSIAHYLADALVEVEASKLLCYEAAWAKQNGKELRRLASMAKIQSCETFRAVASVTIQIYGGLGFTLEADPQLFFRRAKHLQNSLWDYSYLRNQLSEEILG